MPAQQTTDFYYNTQRNSRFLEYWTDVYLNTNSTNLDTVVISNDYENRPDLYSFYLYNTPRYFWTFKYLNPSIISNPIWDFNAGKEIKIFKSSYLSKVN